MTGKTGVHQWLHPTKFGDHKESLTGGITVLHPSKSGFNMNIGRARSAVHCFRRTAKPRDIGIPSRAVRRSRPWPKLGRMWALSARAVEVRGYRAQEARQPAKSLRSSGQTGLWPSHPSGVSGCSRPADLLVDVPKMVRAALLLSRKGLRHGCGPVLLLRFRCPFHQRRRNVSP
jgi:hypothetical protein